jgi:gliding motility-associated-like protein/uncharacterized repeat protein (TIGR01451 family)
LNKHRRIYQHLRRRLALWQVLGLFMSVPASAQSAPDTPALYIAPNAAMYVHQQSIGVFANVINSGAFGSFKGTTVHMYGGLWRNTATGNFPDEGGVNSFTGTGGNFRFVNTGIQQYLTGGYSLATKSGPSFPNLVLANPLGVFLYQGDAQVRNILRFESGPISLNGSNLVVGVNDPGTITGYTETFFVATGNTSKGGYLYRSKISGSSGSVVFPVGPQTGSYAPISVMFNAATPQDLHVRSFDNIYSGAFQGTTGSPYSLQQSWNIGQENTAKVATMVALQHHVSREGPAFTVHRGNSFVSWYDFNARAWDTLPPSGITSPGMFTTAAFQVGTFVNTRALDSLGQNVYLTKTAESFTDSITLSKAALTPVRQPDGSFLVTYMFLVNNAGRIPAKNVKLLDTLTKVFIAPATFSTVSVSATGNLVANTAFDGVSNLNLLQASSMIAPKRTDTVLLALNVNPNQRGAYYYNSASIEGVMTGGNGGQYVLSSGSVNSMSAVAPATPPLPTPVALAPSKYNIPGGFSPNGDGVNDKFVIDNLAGDNASVWIFTRYGTQVYRNANYKNDWDGRNSLGDRVEDGTYFYKIIITEAISGKQESFYGFISIWR